MSAFPETGETERGNISNEKKRFASAEFFFDVFSLKMKGKKALKHVRVQQSGCINS